MKKYFILYILLIFRTFLFSQKNITNQSLIWYALYNTIKFNDKWYFQNEIHERRFINPDEQHQFLIVSLLHKIFENSGWECATAMCVFFQSPNDHFAKVKLITPELRPNIEFAYKQKLKYFNLEHRYTLEARRFHNTNQSKTELIDGFAFGNFRFRYRLQATIPVFKIVKNYQVSLKLSDEIFINKGDNIIINSFDQNRMYAGINCKIWNNCNFEVGYLNWFQQRESGDYYNRDILRFTIYHKINF